jgi:CubicO group peptidase (beta-lactamase class C family)
MKKRTILLISGLTLSITLLAGGIVPHVTASAVDDSAAASQTIGRGSGWPVSGDRYDRDKIRELNRQIAQRDFKDITSVVVIKDGKLLIEEYFNGADRTTLHNPRSVGKTFTSALMGIALRDGYIKSIDQTLGEFYDLKSFANFSTKKSAVTLKDLLTMSSAFLGSDADPASPGNEENMYPTPNWVKFALNLPMDEDKENGKQWDYFTAGVVLLGDILDRSVPGGLEKYADRVLFKPLGITRYEWAYTPQKVVNTAGGLQMSSLDYAKFGQLYKNRGRWNGVPVLPEEWVAQSFHKYLAVPNNVDTYYGLLFWNKTYHVDGRPYETFFCTGNGGNKIFVFLDQPLVVVITATAYGKPYMHSQVDTMMGRFVLPAVIR